MNMRTLSHDHGVRSPWPTGPNQFICLGAAQEPVEDSVSLGPNQHCRSHKSQPGPGRSGIYRGRPVHVQCATACARTYATFKPAHSPHAHPGSSAPQRYSMSPRLAAIYLKNTFFFLDDYTSHIPHRSKRRRDDAQSFRGAPRQALNAKRHEEKQ